MSLRGRCSVSQHRPHTPSSKPNFTVFQRKNWHGSLHSITQSHNSQSHTHRLRQSYRQAQRHTRGSQRSEKQTSTSVHWGFINQLYSFIHRCSFCFLFLSLSVFFTHSWMSSSPSAWFLPPTLHLAKLPCFEADFPALLLGMCSLNWAPSSSALY